MTLIKKNELKAMTAEQIKEKLAGLNKELLKLNAQRAVGTTIESPGRIKLIRRTIARLLTLQTQKQQGFLVQKKSQITALREKSQQEIKASNLKVKEVRKK